MTTLGDPAAEDPWALVLVVHRPRAPSPVLDGVAQGAVSATLELIERAQSSSRGSSACSTGHPVRARSCCALAAPAGRRSRGKWAAQCAHAAQLLRERLPGPVRGEWSRTGFAVTVRRADRERWDAALALPHAAVVRDAGLTEVAPGTATVCAPHAGAARPAAAP